MTTVAMNNLWNYIQGLNLSARNQAWLGARLTEAAKSRKTTKADPTLLTKDEFFANIEEAERQIERGEGTRFENRETMNIWLQSL